MAQAALTARNQARTAYDISKERATRRGGGDENNVNLSLFEPAVTQVKADWTALEASQINYVTKAALLEEPRNAELRTWGTG